MVVSLVRKSVKMFCLLGLCLLAVAVEATASTFQMGVKLTYAAGDLPYSAFLN
jgi:hypothetical protein